MYIRRANPCPAPSVLLNGRFTRDNILALIMQFSHEQLRGATCKQSPFASAAVRIPILPVRWPLHNASTQLTHHQH